MVDSGRTATIVNPGAERAVMVKRNGFVKSFVLRSTIVVMLLMVAEAVAFLSSFFLPRDFVYVPPTRQEFESFVAQAARPSTIRAGWRPSAETAPAGYRISPSGKGLGKPCVSLYGDSFTWGVDVADAETWGDVLSRSLGCRIDNYGVSGYGTDQAYLRFLDNRSDVAPVVILAHFSENIVRNVNQDRGFIYGSGIVLKPVFQVDGEGRLNEVEQPRLRREDYARYVADPGSFLEVEYFFPDSGPMSRRTLGFPYVVSVPRLLTYKRLYSGIAALLYDAPPWYDELYDPAHRSRALEVTTRIIESFDREARRRKRSPVVLVLPSVRDIGVYRTQGRWVYQSLLENLSRSGITAINVGTDIAARIGKRDACDYLCSRRARRSGHYTAEGNLLLAEIVKEHLDKIGLPVGASR